MYQAIQRITEYPVLPQGIPCSTTRCTGRRKSNHPMCIKTNCCVPDNCTTEGPRRNSTSRPCLAPNGTGVLNYQESCTQGGLPRFVLVHPPPQPHHVPISKQGTRFQVRKLSSTRQWKSLPMVSGHLPWAPRVMLRFVKRTAKVELLQTAT